MLVGTAIETVHSLGTVGLNRAGALKLDTSLPSSVSRRRFCKKKKVSHYCFFRGQ